MIRLRCLGHLVLQTKTVIAWPSRCKHANEYFVSSTRCQILKHQPFHAYNTSWAVGLHPSKQASARDLQKRPLLQDNLWDNLQKLMPPNWTLRKAKCCPQNANQPNRATQPSNPNLHVQRAGSIFALLAASPNAAAVRLTCLLVARLNWRRELQRFLLHPQSPNTSPDWLWYNLQHVKNSMQMIGNTVSSQNLPQNIPFDFIKRLRQIQVYDPSAVLSNNKLAANKCCRAEPEQQSSSCSVFGTGWPKKNCEFEPKRAKRNITYSSRNNTKMNLQETLRFEGHANKQNKCIDIKIGRCS